MHLVATGKMIYVVPLSERGNHAAAVLVLAGNTLRS